MQEKKKRDAISEEAAEKSRLMEEKEQEERRLKLEQGGIKMIGDNRRMCGTKKEKVQEKLLKKIALPTEEEEKEVVKDHEKTNIVRKIVERECEDKELILDNDETEKLQKYRRKKDGIETDEEDQGDAVVKTGRSEKTKFVPDILGGSSRSRSKRGRDAEDGEMEDKVNSVQEDEFDDEEEIRRKREETEEQKGPVEKKARQESRGEVRCHLLLNK